MCVQTCYVLEWLHEQNAWYCHYCTSRHPSAKTSNPPPYTVSCNGTLIPWLQNYTRLQSSWKVTEMMWHWSTKRSSARRIPPHKPQALTLWVGTEMAAAQDCTGWSTSDRAISTLYHPVQPPTRCYFKSPLSTWLGDVNFPLQMSTFPLIVLATPPTTKMTSHGSINYQKSLATPVGTSMLKQFLGWLCLYITSWLSASWLDGSTLKGYANQWYSNTSREGWPKCWNQYARCLAGEYGHSSLLLMGSHSRTLLRPPPVAAYLG